MTTTFVGFTIFTFDFVDYITVLYSKWQPVVESFDKKNLKLNKYSPITSSIYVEQIAISRWLQLQNNSDLKVHKQREIKTRKIKLDKSLADFNDKWVAWGSILNHNCSEVNVHRFIVKPSIHTCIFENRIFTTYYMHYAQCMMW